MTYNETPRPRFYAGEAAQLKLSLDTVPGYYSGLCRRRGQNNQEPSGCLTWIHLALVYYEFLGEGTVWNNLHLILTIRGISGVASTPNARSPLETRRVQEAKLGCNHIAC